MHLRHAWIPLCVAIGMPALLAAQQGHTVNESEPNDDIATATLLHYGDTISAKIDRHSDRDYFALDIPAGAKIQVTIRPSFCMGLNMSSADQTFLLGRNCYTEHGDSLYATTEKGGRYYIRVLHDDDRPDEVNDPPLPYTIHIGPYTPPAPGPGNPMRRFAIDAGRVTTMVAAPNGDMILLDDIIDDRSGYGHTRVRRSTAQGQITTLTEVSASGQVAIDAFGDLLVPSYDDGGVVWRISLATGARTRFTGPPAGPVPYAGVTIGADGDVWLSEPGTAAIGGSLSRFDAFGHFKQKLTPNIGSILSLSTAQNGEVFFLSGDKGDVYRLVNNAAPQRVIAGPGPYPQAYRSFGLDKDGWVYVTQPVQGKLLLYNAQYQLARDPLAWVLDSIGWADKFMAEGLGWMRDANGTMTSRLLTVRGPNRYEHALNNNEILEANPAGMGAPGADPMLHITEHSLAEGAVTVSYADTLHVSGTSGSASWSVVAGSLPAGLTLGSAGVVSGTPSQTGNSEFTIKATDGARAGFGRFSITVTAAPAVVVSLPDVAAALLGGPAVSSAVAEYLDQRGNKNGKLDVGDLRAYLRAQGKLGGVSTP